MLKFDAKSEIMEMQCVQLDEYLPRIGRGIQRKVRQTCQSKHHHFLTHDTLSDVLSKRIQAYRNFLKQSPMSCALC